MPSVCVPSSTCKLFLTVRPFTKNPCSLVLFPLLPFVPVTVGRLEVEQGMGCCESNFDSLLGREKVVNSINEEHAQCGRSNLLATFMAVLVEK